ncbi:MAG: c-type cytochrome [Thiotrichales bacterium]|nr:c-type cytochrome [Thiotrichales bacterium]
MYYLGQPLVILFASNSTFAKEEPISPVRAPKLIDLAKFELGKKLYYERRLSQSGHFSCNLCHNLSLGGVDNLQFPIGDKWQKGRINTPTVLNSSLNFAQYWDGRAATLEEQARGAIENPASMATSHVLVADVLKTIPGYVTEFKQAFDDGEITIASVASAIAEFEKTLVTLNSPFDMWLLGNKNAISEYELSGYKIFKNVGCTNCHNGPGVGGQSFQKFGVFEPYKTTHPSRGRSAITGESIDDNVFKVPLLRNIELTYPYFHDGAIKTLEEAVNAMGRVQLGIQFNDDETARVVAFLKTLTGVQPSFPLPTLPASGVDTPRPSPF